MATIPNYNKSDLSTTLVMTHSSPNKYVVVRGGHRVSDREYDSPDNPQCLDEIKFWSGISNSSSYGEKVEVVLYDSKIHRVW